MRPRLCFESERGYTPATFGIKVVVIDTSFPQMLQKRFDYKKAPTKYVWNEDVFYFPRGDVARYMRPWKDVHYVYFVVNINDNHWVMCEKAFST